MWTGVPLVALLLLAGCKHRHSDAGTQPATGSASNVSADQADAARRQTELLNLQAVEMETEVPAAVQRALPSFKDALVKLTDDVLAGQPKDASASQVEQVLRSVLPRGKAPNDAQEVNAAKAGGKNEDDIPQKGEYGGELSAAVSELERGTLLVDSSFGIMCGEDHVLLGYSNASGRWRRVLRWQSEPYDKVSGGFGDIFMPVLLRPRRAGHAVLLVVHGTPWCTSTESRFAMDTFEVDPSVMTNRPFWHSEHDYRRADDVPPLAFSLKTTPDGFVIRASVDDPIGDGINRLGIMRYALVGNTMRRTFPIAMNSRESVSEWLDMPVEEARLFTDAQPGSGAWQMWQALSFQNKNEDQAQQIPSISYGDVRSCSDAKHYQLELKTEVDGPDHKSHSPGPTYYVQVQQIAEGYAVRDVLLQADPTCDGSVIPLKSSGYQSETSTQ